MMRRTFGYLSFELKLIFGCFILGYFLGMRFQGSTIQLHTVMSGHRDLLANKASQNHELQSNISAALRERKLVHESLAQIAEDVFVYEPIAKVCRCFLDYLRLVRFVCMLLPCMCA
jgi:hypothetical protein